MIFGKYKNRSTLPIRRYGGESLMVAMFACALVALTGFSLTKLHNTSFRSLLSSEATMQAQHYAKTKMDYLVFCGYNSLVAQGKTAINDTTYKDAVVLGAVATDSNGVSRRTVTVNVYNEDENAPRATLSQVFYSNDANRFVVNGSSTANAISLHYDSSNDRLYAKVDGNEKNLGGSVPVGTIIAWPGSSAPTEGGTWLLCNGQSCSSYPALVAIVGSTVPNLEGRFLEGTTSTPRGFKNAGLPNITGTTANSNDLNSYPHVFTGAFYWSYNDTSARNANDQDGGSVARIGFDASRCSSIYGASTTVQPASYTVRYYIKAA